MMSMNSHQHAIGVDIGGTSIRAARVSRDGKIIDQASAATANSGELVLAQLDALLAALDQPSVIAIGIGVPSPVDSRTGEVFRGGFVDLSGPPLVTRLKNTGGRPVVSDNDGTMALLAEARIGAARGRCHIVMLTIGTGIGGAAMLDGKIVRGRATAGELGHICVDMNGLLCVCGRQGCFETLSSGTALRRHIAEAGLRADCNAESLLARRDATARAVIERWIRPLRSGIDSLVAILDPEVVVLGGGLGHAACAALADFPARSTWFQCPVVPAELGSGAGVIGAALAAFERMLQHQE